MSAEWKSKCETLASRVLKDTGNMKFVNIILNIPDPDEETARKHVHSTVIHNSISEGNEV